MREEDWAALLVEEQLSENLAAEDARASGGASQRGLSPARLGHYRRQVHRRRVHQVLGDFRDRRRRANAARDAAGLYSAVSEATRRTYQLYKRGSILDAGREVDLFDYWRFVIRGASDRKDRQAALNAWSVLSNVFGHRKRFQPFLEHKRKIIHDLH